MTRRWTAFWRGITMKTPSDFIIRADVTLRCPTHGEYAAVKSTLPIICKDFYTPCPHCEQEAENQRAIQQRERIEAGEAARRAERWQCVLSGAGIGRRYWDATLDTWQPQSEKQRKVLEVCRRYAVTFNPRGGKGLFLRGGVGTGKTHLAMAILKTVLEKHTGRYCTLSRLLSGVRSCYGAAATRTEDSFFEEMASYDLLVLDEIGIKTLSADEFNTLFRVIDERYMDSRCTIIAANLNGRDMEDTLTERITDRLAQSVTQIVFDWESRRGK